MKPSDILREIAYPLSNVKLLLANGLFALVMTFVISALRAGPFGMLSLPLAIISLPAIFRYALYLLEARAHGRQTTDLGIELFNWADSSWSLFPLVLLGLLAWIDIYIHFNISPLLSKWMLGLFFVIYPASVAVLGITRSPLGSLNPVNLYRMVRLCGIDYLWIPLVLSLTGLALYALFINAVWLIGLSFAVNYAFFLMFTLTGAVLQANGVEDEISIDEPLQPGEEQITEDLNNERQKVATHAYGFISRGNRDGGLLHIRQWIGNEADTEGACRWFFHEMLRWEANDAALFFAQEYFAHLISQELDLEALKLLSRCLHEDSRWKPLQRDRAVALELAEKYQRDDLLKFLTT